jgi:hypothetical protein
VDIISDLTRPLIFELDLELKTVTVYLTKPLAPKCKKPTIDSEIIAPL